jgi:hypothetical protein
VGVEAPDFGTVAVVGLPASVGTKRKLSAVIDHGLGADVTSWPEVDVRAFFGAFDAEKRGTLCHAGSIPATRSVRFAG